MRGKKEARKEERKEEMKGRKEAGKEGTGVRKCKDSQQVQ